MKSTPTPDRTHPSTSQATLHLIRSPRRHHLRRSPPEEYDRLREHDQVLEAVHEGLADAEAGRTISNDELGVTLDELFGPLKDR